MSNLNQVNLIGNITRDVETRYTPSGTAIVDFGLAINRSWKNDRGERQEEPTFVDVTLWARMAEIAVEYCHKGDPLFVSGRLHLDTWADRQTGEKRSRLKVVGEQIQLLASRQQASAAPSPIAKPAAAPASRPAAPAAKSRPESDPDLDAAPPDDCPF